MRGICFGIGASLVIMASVLVPESAMARDSDQNETANCPESKRMTVVRPLTEPAPVRKKNKVRARRVLM